MEESNQTETSPRLFQFQNSELFQNRGNFKMKGFHFNPKFSTIFGIPQIEAILEPREFQSEGVSNLSLKLSAHSKLSHFEGELQTDEFPRLSDSKSFHYFQTGSFILFQKQPRFLEFQNSKLF
mgnify:CR=1 FL=1